jgi:hypothetical protein
MRVAAFQESQIELEDAAMSKIIAARFPDMAGAEAVLSALPAEGFDRSEFQSFYVNPEGQHALHPVGGDAHSDEGAKRADEGALRGAVIGGCLGLLAGILLHLVFDNLIAVLAGAALGAYVGSLLGALSRMRSGSLRKATVEHPVVRPPGQMVAIQVDRPGTETRAIETLQRYGAHDIERTEGEWRAGNWKDFDPRIPSPQD